MKHPPQPAFALSELTPTWRQHIFDALDEEVVRYLMLPAPPPDISHTDAFIARTTAGMDSGDCRVWAILSEGHFAGLCGVHDLRGAQPYFGIWMLRTARGKGVALAALRQAAGWAFENAGCSSLAYDVDERNAASINLVQRIVHEPPVAIGKPPSGKDLRLWRYLIRPEHLQNSHLQ